MKRSLLGPPSFFLVFPNSTVTDVILAHLPNKMPEPRIMENDTIELCGEFTRLYSYQAAGNYEVTAPVIVLDTVRRIKNADLSD